MRLFGIFCNPAKRYARELGPFLSKNWGASLHYTQGQIERAVRELRLDSQFIVFGYAAFMSQEDFEKLRGRLAHPLEFHEARAALQRFAPPHQWSGGDKSMLDPIEVSSGLDFHLN